MANTSCFLKVFRFKIVRDELWFSTSDNEHAPESPMLLSKWLKNRKALTIWNLSSISNLTRDELALSANENGNGNAPAEPILQRV